MFRFLAWSDIERLQSLLDDEEVARNLKRVPFPYSREAAAQFVRTLAEQRLDLPPMYGLGVGGKSCWAIHSGGELAGALGFTPGSGSEEGDFGLGYWLGRRYWGQGLASRAVAEACRWAFEQAGARRISASVFSWNPASVRVLEKNGFQFEGCRRRAILRLGRECDLLNYGLLADELRQIT
ncbi:GNAT family N-acetyltransferase [bacterium]|nr:GNAT family N-acetyltransferase [bacterium]